jgi:outer membrane protein insertion porin family
VRGFERDAIGPSIGDQVVGGNKELVFNAELQFPIIEPLVGLIFFDTGGAFAEDQNYELDEMRMGAGVGIRFFTPMGPIRLDWGYKLDREEGEDPSEFHFAMGTYF